METPIVPKVNTDGTLSVPADSAEDVAIKNLTRTDVPLMTPRSIVKGEAIDFVLDRDWGKQAFMVNDLAISSSNSEGDKIDVDARYRSTASRKWTDTTMGGNIGVNSRPQFTRYSDIRNPGLPGLGRNKVSVSNDVGNYGMGRYYSEAIDDPSQTIYLRFGLPQYASLSTYFAAAFDPDMSSLARTGKTSSVFRTASRTMVSIALLITFPVFTIAVGSAKILAGFFRSPTTKFYSMRPAMHLYWGTVNSLVNAIAINKGIYKKIALLDGADKETGIGTQYKVQQDDLNMLSSLMPGVFDKSTGSYNMYTAVTKAQRYSNAAFEEEYRRQTELGESNKSEGWASTLANVSGFTNLKSHTLAQNLNHIFMLDAASVAKAAINTVGVFVNPLAMAAVDGAVALASEYNKQFSTNATRKEAVKDANGNITGYIDVTVDKDGKSTPAVVDKETTPGKGFFDHLNALNRQGADFVILKVEATGSMSEAFGNSVGESDLAQKLNSSSSNARSMKFSMANGNISDNAVVGAITSVVGAAIDTVKGGLDAVTFGAFGAIEGLMGNGYLDIPKTWNGSSTTFPRASYKMKLVSPYGNPFSQMQNIYIPLSMLMAGTLPLSTGKQSYTSPMLCQVYDRGRCQIQLGMIESLQITRGTGNLTFNTQGNAMGVDVSFDIVDLSTIMHMPIGTGDLLGPDPYSDPDSVLMDYLAVLGGMDICSQVYAIPKARIALAKRMANYSTKMSSSFWASYTHDSLTSGWMKFILPLSVPYNIGGAVNASASIVNSGR